MRNAGRCPCAASHKPLQGNTETSTHPTPTNASSHVRASLALQAASHESAHTPHHLPASPLPRPRVERTLMCTPRATIVSKVELSLSLSLSLACARHSIAARLPHDLEYDSSRLLQSRILQNPRIIAHPNQPQALSLSPCKVGWPSQVSTVGARWLALSSSRLPARSLAPLLTLATAARNRSPLRLSCCSSLRLSWTRVCAAARPCTGP